MFTGAWDWATGLPDWVTEGYDRAEAKFADGATSLIRDISRDVNAVIEDCKALIQQARKDIDAVVKSLPANLQTWAQGEAARLNQQLDGLDKRVDQTQKGINKDLISRANGAVQEVRERVHDLREKAKGALGKIAAALVEFAKNPAKAIVNGLLRMLGIPPDSFWSMVDRLGDVVGAIAKDPVKFGKTLISGAAQGFAQFFEHFPQHLREILMSWLFGTVATAGVPMPTDFSGPGIMATVLGVVGIDSGLLTSMLGADLSDPAEMAEAQQELAGALSGDPRALVNLLREHFDPASLVPMIKEAAMSFLIQALITRVAARIAAMLVPGGAILQAVEAIFRVLVWVVTNAARIFTLIESLVATAGQAVAGNVAGVAAGVESSLVQIIVLVIDFLAGYLGLGGLPAKLKEVIMKLGGKLKGALKKVIDAISKRAKAKAKAKRDQKPNADKKPDADTSAPTQPRAPASKPDADGPDARSPTKRDDDDAGPDGKPRRDDDDGPDGQRRRDDDVGPDGKPRRRDDDGPDGKPRRDRDGDGPDGKRRDRDKDRDKKDRDHANVRAAARRAADQGWRAASQRCDDRVVRESELEAALRSAEGVRGGIRIKLDIVETGSSWKVKASASRGSARATADEGRGWIARGEHGERWYAARDVTSFNEALIKEALGELKRPNRDDDRRGELHSLRESYQEKVEAGRRVEDKMQGRLDAKIRGLKLSIEMEPFSGAEKDKQVKTTVTVAPNMSRGEGQVDLEETRFPDIYEVGEPQAPTKVARIGTPKTYLRPIPVPPMKSPQDRWPGYVINMAAIPGEVKANMAVRYAEGAWHDSDEKNLGAARTGVVVGVNTRERLDEKLDTDDKAKVTSAVPTIQHQDAAGNDITMAAFGFAWAPNWTNKKTGERASMSEVRAEYKKIEDPAEKTEAGNLDRVNAKTLPYGIFREEVLGSDYTQTAAKLISAIADPVHVLSQDADGSVAAASGKGVLAEYDEVLRAMDRQPMLVIGGYNFDDFKWDDHDPERKQQLTRLANELDRAIRAALAEIYPDMLYPSEPNTLMKAIDERDGGGIFQDPQHQRDLEAARVGADGDRMGRFYGLGQNEGRNAMLRMREVAGDNFSMDYRPSAGTSTSPLPNNDARGLVRHRGMVWDADDGILRQGDDVITDPGRRDPYTGLSTQSQSYADPRTQAREYDKVTPVIHNLPPMSPEEEEAFREGHRQALRQVFLPAEDAARSMVQNPDLTPDSPQMQRHRDHVDDAVRMGTAHEEGPASHEAARRAIEQAGEFCKQLITAMTAQEFRSIWQRLKTLLDQVMSERPPQRPRPPGGGRR